MPPVGAERWFHTLVVVGAALGGCSGRTVSGPETGGSNGDAGANTTGGASPMPNLGGFAGQPAGGASPSPKDCAFDAQFVCDDYEAQTGCHCNLNAPTDRSSCESQFDFVCDEVRFCPRGYDLCIGSVFVDCRCDTTRPRPEDCENPEQFYCASGGPYWRDWSCRSEPPVDPDSCRDSYCCQSDDPRFGCGCFCAQIK